MSSPLLRRRWLALLGLGALVLAAHLGLLQRSEAPAHRPATPSAPAASPPSGAAGLRTVTATTIATAPAMVLTPPAEVPQDRRAASGSAAASAGTPSRRPRSAAKVPDPPAGPPGAVALSPPASPQEAPVAIGAALLAQTAALAPASERPAVHATTHTTGHSTTSSTTSSTTPSAAPACPAVRPEHLPPPVQVRYSLQRGGLRGDGLLSWQLDGERYRLRLEGQVPLFGTLLRQTSEGGVDACGVAPLRHTDKRLGKSERALSFVRPAAGSAEADAGELRFSTRPTPVALEAGTQDRLSWLVQLASRLNGWPGGSPPDGSHVPMTVAAVGGDVQRWTFTVMRHEADGLLHLRREPDDPFDTHAEVWTDPRRSHWPVRVELREARGDPLVLQLTDWQPLPRPR
jgi:hypothetical protein